MGFKWDAKPGLSEGHERGQVGLLHRLLCPGGPCGEQPIPDGLRGHSAQELPGDQTTIPHRRRLYSWCVPTGGTPKRRSETVPRTASSIWTDASSTYGAG